MPLRVQGLIGGRIGAHQPRHILQGFQASRQARICRRKIAQGAKCIRSSAASKIGIGSATGKTPAYVASIGTAAKAAAEPSSLAPSKAAAKTPGFCPASNATCLSSASLAATFGAATSVTPSIAAAPSGVAPAAEAASVTIPAAIATTAAVAAIAKARVELGRFPWEDSAHHRVFTN